VSDAPRNWEQKHADFMALLAPYDLRDGHDPSQPFARERSFVGRGWHGLLKELIEDLIRLGWDRRVLQIKEKFGTLRFYVADRQPEYLDRIEAAVEHSAEICEECGKAGALRANEKGWYSTRCDACACVFGLASRPGSPECA